MWNLEYADKEYLDSIYIRISFKNFHNKFSQQRYMSYFSNCISLLILKDRI